MPVRKSQTRQARQAGRSSVAPAHDSARYARNGDGRSGRTARWTGRGDVEEVDPYTHTDRGRRIEDGTQSEHIARDVEEVAPHPTPTVTETPTPTLTVAAVQPVGLVEVTLKRSATEVVKDGTQSEHIARPEDVGQTRQTRPDRLVRSSVAPAHRLPNPSTARSESATARLRP